MIRKHMHQRVEFCRNYTPTLTPHITNNIGAVGGSATTPKGTPNLDGNPHAHTVEGIVETGGLLDRRAVRHPKLSI